MWKCAHQSKPDLTGPAGQGWNFQQGKEVETDWCQGSFLLAELFDIICDDPLQLKERDDDEIELVNLCDSKQEEDHCKNEIQN